MIRCLAAFASSCFFAGFDPPGPALGSVRWELALERSGACWPLLPSPSRPALLPSSAAALPFLQVAWLRPSAALDSRGPAQAFGQRGVRSFGTHGEVANKQLRA
jgi:hypothetical protein